MATKNNIRSMRFSDTMIDMIEAQAGDTFTAKFEALVTRCMWELPAKERQLENINMEIKEKREQLGRMSNRVDGYRLQLQSMDLTLQQLSRSIAKAQEIYWEE